MHDELQDRIVYGEHQIKYLQDEIIKEQRYRQRVRRDEKKNHGRLMIYTALTCILSFILLLFSLWEMFFEKRSPDLMLPISLIVLLPVMVFVVFFLAICVCMVVRYGKRLHGDVDWKTFKYMSYKQMSETSCAREKYLHEELLRTEVTYQSDQQLLEERKKNIVPQEMKVISMDEIKQIQDESQNLPDEAADVRKMGYIPKE